MNSHQTDLGITVKVNNRGGKRPFIFVDYLQALKPINLCITEKQHIDMTIVELKRISRDLDLPVNAVSSFNRADYKTDVTFEAFKESGAIIHRRRGPGPAAQEKRRRRHQ